MRTELLRLTIVLAVPLATSLAGTLAADTIALNPDLDNTLIEDLNAGQYSGGQAYHVYAGRVGSQGESTRRRAVFHFDLSAIPAGSTIQSAALRLKMAQSSTGTQQMKLHRLTASFGEGASFGFGGVGAPAEPGDATWTHRFWPTDLWTTPGGDYVAAISATRNVGLPAFYTWGSTPAMVADVQGWVDDPASNFGWILIGNETVAQTVKKFDSAESPDPSLWPVLTIEFTAPPPCVPADLDCNGSVDGADLGLLLAAWGSAGPADLDGSGTVDGADLGLLLAEWG